MDSSYAVHPDMKSHKGLYMTLRKGATYTGSCKQKLNTKSSTEAELVAVDDTMGQVLWTRHFLSAQGVHVPTTTIYQDNMSTILLAKNGRSSSSKLTSKKRIRKNRILSYREYAGRFLYKTTTGKRIQNMREIILNMPDDANGNTGHRSVLGIDKKTTSRNEKSDENAKKAPAEENRTRNLNTGMKEK